ncbi:MAG: hypothetical protein GY771_08935 [bacterium]|nr:hypothetical protein [bacterium]
MIVRFEDYTYELTDAEYRQFPWIKKYLRAATKEKPIKNERIGELTGLSPARVRKIIHEIRVSGEIPLLVSTTKGYWPSDRVNDVEVYIAGLDQRIRSITEMRDAVAKQLAEGPKQRVLIIEQERGR